MSVNVQLTKETVAALKAKLKQAREDLRNDGVVMRQCAIFLDQWVQRNFQSLGGKVGKWEPYKYGGRLTTLDPKAKSHHGRANAQSIDGHRYINTSAKLLQDSGALKHSFLPFIRKGIAGIGSELPYSKPHDEGTNGMIQRRMLPETSEVQADIREILDNFLVIQIRKANA